MRQLHGRCDGGFQPVDERSGAHLEFDSTGCEVQVQGIGASYGPRWFGAEFLDLGIKVYADWGDK